MKIMNGNYSEVKERNEYHTRKMKGGDKEYEQR
jgi:hypothetical protein